jgi:hypothetical protein
MALHNLARMTTATSGTGTITLGSAVSGFLSFADAGVANAEVVTYSIRDGANSEIGKGTYTTSGTTLSRDTVYESTNGGSKISLSGSAEVFITPAAENLNIIDPYGIHHRLSGSHADDDEFATDTTGSYTAINPTGTATWVAANHALNCVFSGQSANDAGAFVKAITLADNEWFETAATAIMVSGNYTMFGFILTDGTANGSNAFTLQYTTDGSTVYAQSYSGTVTALTSVVFSTALSVSGFASKFRMRMKRHSSTDYRVMFSTEDGAQWSAFGLSTSGGNPGFTPTHAGLFATVWGGAHTSMVAFDYLRHMS